MGNIRARAWKLDVGRIELYLLDTNLKSNPPEIRDITSRLYAGEPHIRVAQEILLGIGGMRLLERVGKFPSVCHLNEGHCSFVCLERLAQIMRKFNLQLQDAMELLPRTNVFTTHTPVAAGYDTFPVDMVRPYLEPYTEIFKVPVEEIISWGQRGWKYDPGGKFCMFTFGLRFSQFCNGVSQLHGKVARKMWQHVWPDRPLEEVPIKHVTNGVHVTSWISIENHLLFERYIGPRWYTKPEEDIVSGIDSIYEEELWRARELSRARLIRFCRYMMRKQYLRRNAPKSILDEVETVLDPDVLTIGFARRFTAYKRANLILKDPERIKRFITSKKYPVQFIFAGKAHPKDEEGKRIIQQIINFARDSEVRHRFIFLENYDINIARHLVQGVDVWLNTPRRPFEACGTSGMKAAINGVLNFSVLDGWWCEGYREDRGWEIGGGKEYSDPEYQNEVEAHAIYNILEEEIIPVFYQNRRGNIPLEWVHMMKESMKMCLTQFSAKRMVREYVEKFYFPAAKNFWELSANNCEKAKEAAIKRKRLLELWGKIKVNTPMKLGPSHFRVGDEFEVISEVYLGELLPEDVVVELYLGKLKGLEQVEKSMVKRMDVYQDNGNGTYIYKVKVKCTESGRYGFNVRVVPDGDDYLKYTPHFITWAQ
jgi:starch phosphorylase